MIWARWVGGRLSGSSGRASPYPRSPDGESPSPDFATSAWLYGGRFTPADHAALSGAWSWVGDVVGPAIEAGPGGLIDDDLAYVAPWGFNPAQILAPVLLLHGAQDRVVPSSHGQWLAGHCPTAELRLNPDDGHISVLNSSLAALTWLANHTT